MTRALEATLATCALLSTTHALGADVPQSSAQRPIYVTANLGPAMLGTVPVSIRADRFRGNVAQALQDASRSPQLQQLVAPARGLTRLNQIAYVQSRVHTSIRWISDATQWGQHDYWASAVQTLARGAGDMEDRAIVKMHALRALGFDPSDLFLTLARDRVGGPLTVLTVRIAGRYFILDDTGGAPFEVEKRRHEFRPVLSFGPGGSWVHTAAAPVQALAAAPGAHARK